MILCEYKVMDTKVQTTLSPQAIADLKTILLYEIGEAHVNQLSDQDLQDLGLFLLTIVGNQMKIELRQS